MNKNSLIVLSIVCTAICVAGVLVYNHIVFINTHTEVVWYEYYEILGMNHYTTSYTTGGYDDMPVQTWIVHHYELHLKDYGVYEVGANDYYNYAIGKIYKMRCSEWIEK